MENLTSSTETVSAEAGTGKGLFNHPGSKANSIVSWLTTTDHKKIGFLYAMVALLSLVVGGVEAILIRAQLAHPGANIVTAQEYNQLFTMHGTTMVFLAVLPLGTAFFNFVVPLQIGARNVAFPRLNALSLWCFVSGALLLNASWFFPGGAPSFGWGGLAPLATKPPQSNAGLGTDCWTIGLLAISISTLLVSINFLATIINLRCPGMTMMRLPTFTWMALLTSILGLLAFPLVSTALVGLTLDRQFDTLFFNNAAGGNSTLWEHFFWIRGYPEVYILLLPAVGIISEILPTFSNKPLAGYRMTIFSAATLGILGFASWGHDMANPGTGGIASQAFQALTMLAAIPAGILVANWVGTLWGGRIRFNTPMLFASAFVVMFMAGSLTGMMSTTTTGAQLHGTYFAVAHLHYLLVGGSIFALLAGFYYWIPKLTGAMMDGLFGKICFVLIFAGFNLTFLPLHYLGLGGMPSRIHTYHGGIGWDDPNKLASLGAFILGFGILFSIIQVLYTCFNKKNLPQAGKDPWDARTLEWSTSSPVPAYNFEKVPTVQYQDQCWEDKYGRSKLEHSKGLDDPHGILMPGYSWWPLFTGAGLSILCEGLIIRGTAIPLPGIGTWEPNFEGLLAGFILTLVCIVSWAMEPPKDYFLEQEGGTGTGPGTPQGHTEPNQEVQP